METKEYTTIDRVAAGWPAGEWDGEPDKIQWPDAETGLPCLAVRHGTSGHWCGYVGVAEGHPMHQKGYDVFSADVHGGLTFADMCSPEEKESEGVCHIPSPGEPEHVWWFGFDCHHYLDISPRDLADRELRYSRRDGSYRTLEYVKSECRNLARQLIEQPTGA